MPARLLRVGSSAMPVGCDVVRWWSEGESNPKGPLVFKKAGPRNPPPKMQAPPCWAAFCFRLGGLAGAVISAGLWSSVFRDELHHPRPDLPRARRAVVGVGDGPGSPTMVCIQALTRRSRATTGNGCIGVGAQRCWRSAWAARGPARQAVLGGRDRRDADRAGPRTPTEYSLLRRGHLDPRRPDRPGGTWRRARRSPGCWSRRRTAGSCRSSQGLG